MRLRPSIFLLGINDLRCSRKYFCQIFSRFPFFLTVGSAKVVLIFYQWNWGQSSTILIDITATARTHTHISGYLFACVCVLFFLITAIVFPVIHLMDFSPVFQAAAQDTATSGVCLYTRNIKQLLTRAAWYCKELWRPITITGCNLSQLLLGSCLYNPINRFQTRGQDLRLLLSAQCCHHQGYDNVGVMTMLGLCQCWCA